MKKLQMSTSVVREYVLWREQESTSISEALADKGSSGDPDQDT